MGYDVVDRRLAINPNEAEQVRIIFRRFVELGSMLKVAQEVRALGWCYKAWTTKDGRHRPGRPHDRSTIHTILRNRAYLGEIKHKDIQYPGAHPPIVDQALWDEVQALLQVNGRIRGNAQRGKVDFLLKGIVFGPDGRALTPWHTTKRSTGCHYRYYLSTRDIHEGNGASGLPRLPAGELEGAVVEQLHRVLQAPDMIAATVPEAIALDPTLDEAQVTVAMTKVAQIWEQLFPAEQQRLVRLLIERVVVSVDRLEVRLRPCGLLALTREFHSHAESNAA
ncbi:recombinase family protein [Lysobacter sp. FW306-1B-D06B]|uniref:recombinase family protein n=1 Tax=Lysobacter sp. FW306-1B-D06B TaxID=3140250 RepID=UPI0031406EA8